MPRHGNNGTSIIFIAHIGVSFFEVRSCSAALEGEKDCHLLGPKPGRFNHLRQNHVWCADLPLLTRQPGKQKSCQHSPTAPRYVQNCPTSRGSGPSVLAASGSTKSTQMLVLCRFGAGSLALSNFSGSLEEGTCFMPDRVPVNFHGSFNRPSVGWQSTLKGIPPPFQKEKRGCNVQTSVWTCKHCPS